MRPSIPKLIAWSLVAILFYAAFARLAYSAADIPVHLGGYYYPPVVQNDCLLIYGADKSLRCDRVFAGSFQ